MEGILRRRLNHCMSAEVFGVNNVSTCCKELYPADKLLPADKMHWFRIGWSTFQPLDSDLSTGESYPFFEQAGALSLNQKLDFTVSPHSCG